MAAMGPEVFKKNIATKPHKQNYLRNRRKTQIIQEKFKLDHPAIQRNLKSSKVLDRPKTKINQEKTFKDRHKKRHLRFLQLKTGKI